ncbi:hypothetical protein LTR12_013589 [Friedmanniomyces endolithicus]|nr:hypothetical protein LTR12_013589 [Friedmanniomyces endolithicus]
MPSALFLQRYHHGDDIVSHESAIEADQDTEKMWSQPYQPVYTYNNATHGLNRLRTAGVSEAPITPRGPSLTNPYHHQYGWQAHSNQAPASGGSGGGDGMADTGRHVDAHWQYGQGAGYRGDVQGSQGHGWQQFPEYGAYWHDYGQSLYTASSASEWYYPQRREIYGSGHEERYAQPRYDPRLYPPYEQYTAYHQQYHHPLTRQYYAAQLQPPSIDGSDPAFVPLNARPRASVERQQPPRSVSDVKLDTKSRIDKQSRYGQNPLRTTRKFEADFFKPSFAPQMAHVNSPPPPPPPDAIATRSNDRESLERMKSARQARDGQAKVALRVKQQPPQQSSVASGMKTRSQTAESRLKTRPLLVVLDLNGTLLHRAARGGSIFTTRPRVAEFLHYLLANHKVLVWSSAQPANVDAMCKKLFTPEQRAKLVGIWARDKMRLSAQQYAQKVQCYKQLSWVWRNDDIAASCVHVDEWAQDNTVLIDDSVEKAATEPFNLIKMEAFEGTEEQVSKDVLGQVVEYLEVLKGARDVSACIRAAPYYFRPEKEAVFDWMPIVNDMH